MERYFIDNNDNISVFGKVAHGFNKVAMCESSEAAEKVCHALNMQYNTEGPANDSPGQEEFGELIQGEATAQVSNLKAICDMVVDLTSLEIGTAIDPDVFEFSSMLFIRCVSTAQSYGIEL